MYYLLVLNAILVMNAYLTNEVKMLKLSSNAYVSENLNLTPLTEMLRVKEVIVALYKLFSCCTHFR